MNIQVKVQEVLERQTEESVELGAGIRACRVHVVRTREGAAQENRVTEHLDGPKLDPEREGHFQLVPPELLERFRMTGWFKDDKDYSLLIRDPFSHVVAGKPYQVVRIKSYDHTLYDVDGGALPVGLHFDYMGSQGSVNSRYFDLERLVSHLKTRDDVTLHMDRYGERVIQYVPDYNRGDTNGQQFVAFTWHPSVEVFREFVKACVHVDRAFGRHLVAHRMLGNDKFEISFQDDEDLEHRRSWAAPEELDF